MAMYYFLPDALGTVRDIVDEDGDVIQSYEFQEHGLPMPGSGSGSGTGTFSPKTYQGGLSVNDDRNDSGLHLMGHRHFAADLGRFISRDPIGFQGGLNLFNGAGTNPVTYTDEIGLGIRITLTNGFSRVFEYNELSKLGPYLRAREDQVAKIQTYGHSGNTVAGCDRRAHHEAGLWWNKNSYDDLNYPAGYLKTDHLYVLWEKNYNRNPAKEAARFGYYDISDLKFPNLKKAEFKGCNTAGGHPNPEAALKRHPENVDGYGHPHGESNITIDFSKKHPHTTVMGNKGPWYMSPSNDWTLPSSYRNGVSQ